MHKNTRLDRDPFSKALNKSQIQQAAALNAQVSVSYVVIKQEKYLPYTCEQIVSALWSILQLMGSIGFLNDVTDIWYFLLSLNRERLAQMEKSSYHMSPRQ